MKETYERLAKNFFNDTWDLIDKGNNRSSLEDEVMLGAAHSSRFLWGKIGEDVHFQRGEWLLSHVYALLNRAEPCLHHAYQCLHWTEHAALSDFDLAFSYEALARAFACNQDLEKTLEYYHKAKDSAEGIADKEDRDYFLKSLESEPWFGLIE